MPIDQLVTRTSHFIVETKGAAATFVENGCRADAFASASLRARTQLFPETTLEDAIETLRFVQANPFARPAGAKISGLLIACWEYARGDLKTGNPKLDFKKNVFFN